MTDDTYRLVRASGAPATLTPMWWSMLLFLVPMMASNLLQSISATISTVYVGQLIGVSALASVAAFFPIFFFLSSFLVGLSGSATVLISQAHGARDWTRARAAAGTMLCIGLGYGVAVAIICCTFTREILVAIGTPPDVLPKALAYGRVAFAVSPPMFAFITYTALLRGVGDTRSALVALIITTGTALVLSPALIEGWAGFPRLGITGGPCAAAAAHLASLSWLFAHLRRISSPLAPDRKLLGQLKIDRSVLRPLLRLGAPTAAQIILISLSEIAIVGIVNRFGSAATAAYGASNQIVSYVLMPITSVGIAAAVFGAQAIGAGALDQLPRVIRSATGLALTIGASLIMLIYLLCQPLVGWFITAPEIAAVARHLLIISLWSYLILAVATVLQDAMSSSGAVLWPATITIFAIWGVKVPAAYVLSREIGLEGVWLAYPLTFAVGLGLLAAYYVLYWRGRPHRRL